MFMDLTSFEEKFCSKIYAKFSVFIGLVSYHLNDPVHSNQLDYHCNLCVCMYRKSIDDVKPKIVKDKKEPYQHVVLYDESYKQQQQHSIDDNISDSINFMEPCNFMASYQANILFSTKLLLW